MNLCHAIENTANENTGKPLVYIDHNQLSHRALQTYSRRNLVSAFSMAWYEIVMEHFLVVYHGYATCHLYFLGILTSLLLRENRSDSIEGYFVLLNSQPRIMQF